MEGIQQILAQAVEHHRAGRLSEAEALYQRILAVAPDHGDALHLLGLIAHQCGHSESARVLIERALAVNPEAAPFHDSLGRVLYALGRYVDAGLALQNSVQRGYAPHDSWKLFARAMLNIGEWPAAGIALDQALAVQGNDAEAWSLRAHLMVALDRAEAAEDAARQALAHRTDGPAAVAAWQAIALARYHTHDYDGVATACNEALRVMPEDAATLAILGGLRLVRGDAAAAEVLAARALDLDPALPEALVLRARIALGRAALEGAWQDALRAVRLKPGLAAGHAVLGQILHQFARDAEAEQALRRALTLRPGAAALHGMLGSLLMEGMRLAEAEAAFRTALALKPDLAAAYNNLGRLFTIQGRLEEAAACFRKALELDAGHCEAHSNWLVSLNYDPAMDERALLAAHRHWDVRHARAVACAGADGHFDRDGWDNSRDPDRRLRVGYVSADLGRHPVGFFLESVFAHHDPARVEIVVYATRLLDHDLTGRLRAHAALWRPVPDWSAAELARQIRADGIDILVDLSGHTAGNRLPVFAMKPAPIQVSWIGYFHTTGLSAMDYIIMDPVTVPEGAEAAFTEAMVRLPEGRFCYAPPDFAPPPVPPPCLERGHVTFGSFNNLSKVTASVIALWARVLQAVPGARLLLKWRTLRDDAERSRLLAAFAGHGIGPDRLELRPDSPHAAMLAEYGDMDIALDPFPFTGGLTSCEALWMGVPVITLPGPRPVSRQTLGFLKAVGLAPLAADSPERYVALAAALAAQPQGLAALRAELRGRMAAAPLCEGATFTRHVETAYRIMWQRWCRAEPPSAISL